MARRKIRFAYLGLIVPYAALLWVGFYDTREPELFGMPFFYWYQLLWIPFGALLIYPAYRAQARRAD